MPRTPRAAITPAVLAWARELAGFDTAEAARRLRVRSERLASWEAGALEPSLAQLRNAAELYRRPLAFFFLPEPPAPDLPRTADFRGVALEGRLSPALRREMRRAAERRLAYLELHEAHATPIAGFSGDPDDLDAATAFARQALGVSLQEQLATADAAAALKLWLAAVEHAGVLVFQMSRIAPVECRGFSISERLVPVIVLNGADPPQARSFTLLHELGHLLHHTSSMCILFANSAVERTSNAFAAEMLMPAAEFLAELGDEPPLRALPRLATRFRVSQEAAAVRLRVLRRISAADLEAVRAAATRRVQEFRALQREREGGPPHYRTLLRNLGLPFVTTVLDAYHSNQISLVDAAHHLDSKIATIDRMEAALLQVTKRDEQASPASHGNEINKSVY